MQLPLTSKSEWCAPRPSPPPHCSLYLGKRWKRRSLGSSVSPGPSPTAYVRETAILFDHCYFGVSVTWSPTSLSFHLSSPSFSSPLSHFSLLLFFPIFKSPSPSPSIFSLTHWPLPKWQAQRALLSPVPVTCPCPEGPAQWGFVPIQRSLPPCPALCSEDGLLPGRGREPARAPTPGSPSVA